MDLRLAVNRGFIVRFGLSGFLNPTGITRIKESLSVNVRHSRLSTILKSDFTLPQKGEHAERVSAYDIQRAGGGRADVQRAHGDDGA